VFFNVALDPLKTLAATCSKLLNLRPLLSSPTPTQHPPSSNPTHTLLKKRSKTELSLPITMIIPYSFLKEKFESSVQNFPKKAARNEEKGTTK
jgi:hypothetical protein